MAVYKIQVWRKAGTDQMRTFHFTEEKQAKTFMQLIGKHRPDLECDDMQPQATFVDAPRAMTALSVILPVIEK